MDSGKLIKLFASEPYRVFFPLGILFGIYGVSHWLFFAFGIGLNYSGFFHASIQMLGYMGCFVVGFLMTAMPRFASAPTATERELFSFLVLTLGIAFSLTLQAWALGIVLYIIWLLLIVRFAASRFLKKRERKVMPPAEFVWIPVGIFHGLIGSFLMLFNLLLSNPPAWLVNTSKPMFLQGFLFSIVIGVGGFLGPRLMGVSQLINPENIKKEESCTPSFLESRRSRRIKIHLAFAALFFATFWIEGFGYKLAANILRALIVTGEFLFTGVFPRPPRVSGIFAWLLWISFWMVVMGCWGLVFFPSHRLAMMHMILLGGFSLMTYAVGTVVILSHCGESSKLYKPLPALWFVGIAVLSSLALRLLADLFPPYYFKFLGSASVSWLLGAVIWLIYILPKVFRIPEEGTFDREHEASKKRI